MAQAQSLVGAKILIFRPRLAKCASLTIKDRMDVAKWRENAGQFGYDRLVVHERLAGDPPELGSYLAVYRRGEPWARWGITRMGQGLMAWCCVTGNDVGSFATVEEALQALLPQQTRIPHARLPIPFPCVRPAADMRTPLI
jgi:hypothetical protein